MTEARPFASLSSGLLARKGAAKPAMRPQAFGQIAGNIEDLGWNDMGDAGPAEHVPSPIDALTPAPRAVESPPVREQQRAIAEELGVASEPISEPEPRSAPVVSIPRRRSNATPLTAREKAAFTLRLDPERHFRLRLACAITGHSAQQIVTGALDDILKTFPELDAVADRLPVKARSRS